MNIELTPSQHRSATKLDFFFQLGLGNIEMVNGVYARPIPLLAGPSGSGKTFLAGQIAEKYGLPMFCINAQNWIVRGAKNDSQVTMDQIQDFVSQNDRGVIFIDELNKLNNTHVSSSAWSADVFSELLAFLDRDQRLEAMGMSGLTEKLKQNFMIIGAGAFQEQWQASAGNTQSIGFGTEAEIQVDRENAYVLAIRNQEAVPDELLFRFNDQLIVISPPTAEEFGKRITALRAALSLPSLPEKELIHLAKAAVQSDKCMRWLEGYLSECLSELTPDALAALATKAGELGASETPANERKVSQSAAERKKMIAFRDTCFEHYRISLSNLSVASRKLYLLLNGILLAQPSETLSKDRQCLLKCLPKIGELLSPDQPAEEFPMTLIRGLDYLAFNGLKAPSPVITQGERVRIANNIKSVSGKIAEVIPLLISHCGNISEGHEIRARALDVGVFAERAAVTLDELYCIDPNGMIRQRI